MGTHINITDWTLGNPIPGTVISPAQLGYDIDGPGSIVRALGGYNGSNIHARISAQRTIKIPPISGSTFGPRQTVLMICRVDAVPTPSPITIAQWKAPGSTNAASMTIQQPDGLLRCSYGGGGNSATDENVCTGEFMWIKWVYDRGLIKQEVRIHKPDGQPWEVLTNSVHATAIPDTLQIGALDTDTFTIHLYSLQAADGDLYFPPEMFYHWSAADSSYIEIAGRVTDAGQVRARLTQTNSGLGSGEVLTTGTTTPDAKGRFKIVHTLDSRDGRAYNYQLEALSLATGTWVDCGLPGGLVMSTRPGGYSQNQFTVFWGCTRTEAGSDVPDYINNTLAPAQIAAGAPIQRLMCLGDHHYKNSWTSDPEEHMSDYEENKRRAPAWRQLEHKYKSVILRSDHDGGTFGPGGNPNDFYHGPAITANVTGYNTIIPHLPREPFDPGESTYFAEMDGRILRLYVDTRSNSRSDFAASDSSGLTFDGTPAKTPLGYEQDRWLREWAESPLYNNGAGFVGISIAMDFGYIEATSGGKGDITDKYPEWRTWFANLWAGKRMWLINGDWHQGYVYTAEENQYGDFFGMGACGADRESGNTVDILPPIIPERHFPDPWGLDEFPIFLFGTEHVQDLSTQLKVTLTIHDARFGPVTTPYTKTWNNVPRATDSTLGVLEFFMRNEAGDDWIPCEIVQKGTGLVWDPYISPLV